MALLFEGTMKEHDDPSIASETCPVSQPGRAEAISWVSGFGTLWFFKRFARDPLGAVSDALQRHGPLFGYRPCAGIPRRGRTTIFALGAEYNRAVLGNTRTWHTGHLPTGGPPGSALFRLGENVVSLNGPRHQYYRKLLSRPLARSSVEAMGNDISKIVNEAVEGWPLGVVDLWPLAKELMRTVAVALLFSGDQVRGKKLDALISQLVRDSKSPSVYLSRAGFPGRAFENLLGLAEQVESCAMEIASAKQGETCQRDLIAVIVNSADENGAPPKQDVIAGQIPILFGASYETCQTVLSWTIFLLAQHPEIAREVQNEILAACGDGPPGLSRVGELPLLNAVFRESMRLLPPIPFQTRIAAEPAELGGNQIEPGTYVQISPFLTNRAPELYDEPDRFKPERWSRINPSNFEYLAFSAGPRACPGLSFGTGVVKLALVAILSRFRFSLVPETRVNYRVAVTMAPSDGMQMTLSEPDGAWARVPVRGTVGSLVKMAGTP